VALRDWPKARVSRLWRWGMALEVALISLPFLAALATKHRDHHPLPSWPLTHAEQGYQRPTPAERETLAIRTHAMLDSAGVKVLRSNDSVTTYQLDDSVAATLTNRAETLRSITLTPAANRAVTRTLRPILDDLSSGLNGLWRRVLITAVLIYLPIPVSLTALTLLWAWTRRQ
jgi:hypothetical protein